MMARMETEDSHQHLRALAARAVTDSLRASTSRCSAADRAARFRDCVRSLEAEKAKMEVFRRELPISVHLVADVIEWLKEELAQAQHHRRPQTPPPPAGLFAAASETEAPAPLKPTLAAKDDEADANDDKRSWMSSAQLWSCGGSHDDSTDNTDGVAKAHKKVSIAFMPTLTRSAAKPAAMQVPDLSPTSAATAAPSATSSTSTSTSTSSSRRRRHSRGRPGGAGPPSCTAGSSQPCSGSVARKLRRRSRSGS